jgi:hypothetical protein
MDARGQGRMPAAAAPAAIAPIAAAATNGQS